MKACFPAVCDHPVVPVWLQYLALRLGALRLGALRLGALRVGALRLGALRLGALRLGAQVLWFLPAAGGQVEDGGGSHVSRLGIMGVVIGQRGALPVTVETEAG